MLKQVDIDKMIRRIDKHTACQLAQLTGEAVSNFNLFPDSRTTTEEGSMILKRAGDSAGGMGFHHIAEREASNREASPLPNALRKLQTSTSAILVVNEWQHRSRCSSECHSRL